MGHRTSVGRVVYNRPFHKMTLKDAVRIAKSATMQEMELSESLSSVLQLLILVKDLLLRISDYYLTSVDDFAEAWVVIYEIIKFAKSTALEFGGSILERIRSELRSFFPDE